MGYEVADAGHLAPGATYTTPQTVQGSELMRYAAVGDATLLIGGDLTVTVFEVLICLVVGLGEGQKERGRRVQGGCNNPPSLAHVNELWAVL